MTNSISEIADSDVIFIIGSNTTEQHPLVATRVYDAIKTKCAKLIVADPRKIPIAYEADYYLPLAPGTNLALINAMLHVIIAEGLIDANFIAERTEGFESLKASVADFTPEKAALITGLDAELIRSAARVYGNAKQASILYAMGITQHVTGTKNCAALCNLAVITGNIGRAATGVNPLRGQNNVQGACDVGCLPEILPGYAPAGSQLAMDRFSPIWGDFANKPGRKLGEMLDDAAAGKIKALYIIGENPVISDPNQAHVRHALENTELLIVQDIFLSETAQLADIVLPGASFIEKDGTFTNTERRVQRIREAIPPLAGCKPDWLILTELIKAMGYVADYQHPEDIFNEMRLLMPSYAGITYERLAEHQGLCWPCPAENHPGTPYLHKDKFIRGKALLTVNDYENPAAQASEEFPLILTTGRVMHHYHTTTMTSRAWSLNRESPHSFIEMHPNDAAVIGVKDGWLVSISSALGSIKAHVVVTTNIKQGVVFMPFHFAESPVNKLISDKNLDPVTNIPEFKVCAVRVEEA